MRFYSFSLLIEKDAEDGGYLAWSPDLPGCVSAGRTTEEARGRMREAAAQHVAVLLTHGEPVPRRERLVGVEALTISLAV